MSAQQEAGRPFDIARLRHAIEDRDADAMLEQFSDDADMVVIDRTSPPSRPAVVHGRSAIEPVVREVFARPMSHELTQCVVEDDHVAYTENCTYPDGSRVTGMAMLDLRDGRITRHSSVQAWDEGRAGALETADFDAADEVRTFEFGRLDICEVGGQPVGRMTLQPGWRWSEHVRPIAGTDLCMAPHCGYQLAGTLRVRMADGTETDCTPGRLMSIPPGHDAWVVGDEDVVAIDWQGVSDYARR